MEIQNHENLFQTCLWLHFLIIRLQVYLSIFLTYVLRTPQEFEKLVVRVSAVADMKDGGFKSPIIHLITNN